MKRKATVLCLVGSLVACVHMTSVDEYVVLKHTLIESTSEEVDTSSKFIEEQNDSNPSLDSQIRLALVLSSPHASEEKLTRARRIFDNVLTFSSALSPAVRDFVDLNRREINQRLSLIEKSKESARLIENLEVQRSRMQDEIKLLQQDLADTNKKIKALKTIEEAIDRSKKLEMP